MTVPEINYLAVVSTVVASMVVGFGYYHLKVMGSRWMRAIRHDEESIAGGTGSWVQGMVIVASFLTAMAADSRLRPRSCYPRTRVVLT